LQSPGSGGSGPESPSGNGGGGRGGGIEDSGELGRNGGEEKHQLGGPSIGIRSDLLPAAAAAHHPLLLRGGDLSGSAGDLSGLPALEALRRQAGGQNPFAVGGPLGLPLKRPSQPPTPQSSSSGGDPSAAWSFEEQFKQVNPNSFMFKFYKNKPKVSPFYCSLIFILGTVWDYISVSVLTN
jgi:hypothetical protein